jgi:hypothetical protein
MVVVLLVRQWHDYVECLNGRFLHAVLGRMAKTVQWATAVQELDGLQRIKNII